MKKPIILYAIILTVIMNSCHIYKPYNRPEVNTSGMYRDTISVNDTLASDTANMGNLPWQKVFTDPYLQTLISQGLEQNSDLKTAALRVTEAEAGLLSARLSYVPSLNLAPQGTFSRIQDMLPHQWSYNLPVTASWEIDLFGRLLNTKRGAKAALLQSEAYKQAVQTQVIATIANTYYTLLMLDKQLAITEETAANWKKNVETMKYLKEAGRVNEAAVVQSEANSHMIEASIPDIRRQIRETENSLSVILGVAPQTIKRGKLEDQTFPEQLNAGIPVQMLANRPDVKSAEMSLASAYYNTNVARSAFYPQISISGTLGWTNLAGGQIVDPFTMIANAVGSLTQPLFNKGTNIARLKVAKAQQEEALIAFQQSILNAGQEVSNALTLYQTAEEKSIERKKQINSLEKSVEYTQELLTLGTSTYLEVLTAQQSLLSAQLSETSDSFQKIQSVINLYHALGGGR